MPVKDKIPCGIGIRLLQLHRSIGNVHEDDSIVFIRIDPELESLLYKRNLKLSIFTAFRLIELEGRCIEAHALLFHSAIPMDDKASLFSIPCRSDRWGKHGGTASEGKGFTVFALIVSVNKCNGTGTVLLFQRLQCSSICHRLHSHTAL